jgi:hypothetical protein
MYVKRNNEVLSRNHGYSGIAINITYSQCLFLALGIQHAMGMSHIVISGLCVPTFFST